MLKVRDITVAGAVSRTAFVNGARSELSSLRMTVTNSAPMTRDTIRPQRRPEIARVAQTRPFEAGSRQHERGHAVLGGRMCHGRKVNAAAGGQRTSAFALIVAALRCFATHSSDWQRREP